MANGTRAAHTRVQNGKKVHVRATKIAAPTKRGLIIAGVVLVGGAALIGGSSPVWGSLVVGGALGAWLIANRKPVARKLQRARRDVKRSRLDAKRRRVAVEKGKEPKTTTAQARSRNDRLSVLVRDLGRELYLWWRERERESQVRQAARSK